MDSQKDYLELQNELMSNTVDDLIREEGFRSKPYKCTEGVWTIGHGLTYLTERESALILDIRVNEIHSRLIEYEWYRNLNDCRKSVLIMMIFQIGWAGVLGPRGFRKMVKALEDEDFNEAASQMESSRWAKQTPARATRMANKMRIGR